MKVLQVKKFPIFDVFLEDGWFNWTRYLFKKDKLIWLSGDKLVNKQTLAQITTVIKSKD